MKLRKTTAIVIAALVILTGVFSLIQTSAFAEESVSPPGAGGAGDGAGQTTGDPGNTGAGQTTGDSGNTGDGQTTGDPGNTSGQTTGDPGNTGAGQTTGDPGNVGDGQTTGDPGNTGDGQTPIDAGGGEGQDGSDVEGVVPDDTEGGSDAQQSESPAYSGVPLHIYAGDQYSLVLNEDGSVWAWGLDVIGGSGVIGAPGDDQTTGDPGNTGDGQTTGDPGNTGDGQTTGDPGNTGDGPNADGNVPAEGSGAIGAPGDGPNADGNVPAEGSGGGLNADGNAPTEGSGAIVAPGGIGAPGEGPLDESASPVSAKDSPVPVLLEGAVWDEITTPVDPGDYTLELRDDGTLWVSGENEYVLSVIPAPDPQESDTAEPPDNASVQVPGIDQTDNAPVQVPGIDQTDNAPVQVPGIDQTDNAPVQVPGIDHVREFSAGSTHCLVLKEDGSVWGWGDNRHGEIGDFPDEIIKTPVLIIPGPDRESTHSSDIDLTVTKGRPYYLPLEGKGILTFEGVTIKVTYDPAALKLDDAAVHMQGRNAVEGPVIESLKDGEITLTMKKDIPPGKEWSGLITLLMFEAQSDGDTRVSVVWAE